MPGIWRYKMLRQRSPMNLRVGQISRLHIVVVSHLQRPEEALLGANTLLAQIPLSTSSTFRQEVQTLIADLDVAMEEQRGQYNLPRILLEMKAWPHSDAPHRHMDFSHPLI
jgi:hypothetical protein